MRPCEEGITQVENFGIRYQRDGTTLYGLKLESVMEAVLNDISLDNLARVMTDIHMDSSKVTQSLTSEHQGHLLKMVFSGQGLLDAMPGFKVRVLGLELGFKVHSKP